MANPFKNVDYMTIALSQFERMRQEQERLNKPAPSRKQHLYERACRSVAETARRQAWDGLQRRSARGMLMELFYGQNATTVAIVMQSGRKAYPSVADEVETVFDRICRQDPDNLRGVDLPGLTWMSGGARRAVANSN